MKKQLIIMIIFMTSGISSFAQFGGSDVKKISADDARYNQTPTLTNPLQFASVGMVNDLLSPGESKEQCIAATTANITLSGEQTIDNYSVVSGNRVLVKNQNTSSQNGVYVVASGAWSRATDMDSWSELYHSSVFISHGLANTGCIYSSSMTETGTLNSDPISWNMTSKQVLQDLSGSGSTLSGYTIILSGDDTNVTLPSESDPKFATDSSLIKTAVRSWNSSVLKNVDSSDTTRWAASGNESDPVFTSSLAHSIDAQDTTRWGIDASTTNEIQNLSYTASSRLLAIDGTGSTDATLPLADGTNAGLMSNTDYTKLSGVEASANNYVHPTGDGYHHVPATGTTNNGRVLTAGATAGSETWQPAAVSMVYPGSGIALSDGTQWLTSITNNSSNWNTAYIDRMKWDGGSSGLVAATGRTSLGLVIGTDVLSPSGSAANLTNFPILNQNTTGTASNITGTVAVTNGGTGRTTGTTAYSLIATGTTATGAQQTLANGATTEILVGGGVSALPIWTTATGSGSPVRATSPTLVTPNLGIPASGDLSNCTFPTLNQSTTGSASSLLMTSTSGLMKVTGAAAGTTRTKTIRNANDTFLELGGSYTPTGTWNWSSATVTWPTFNQNTTGSAATLTTSRTLAGNSFNGSANVPFTNKFIVQGTTDAGLTGAQFLGALGTGIVKNTTTTGVLSIAAAGTDYVAPNASITGATKTKITYDAKGLVTAGANATTADIASSTDKRYVTDAQLTVIGNTSGTNSGNQNLSLGTVTTTTQPVNISSGTGITLPSATPSTAGLESASDKLKLDAIQAGAEVNVQSDWNATNNALDSYIANKPDLSVYKQKSDSTANSGYATNYDLTSYYNKTQSDDRYNVDSVFVRHDTLFWIQNGVTHYSTNAGAVPQIGDFYQGGYVFYVDPSNSWGLCASSSYVGADYTWNLGSTSTLGTSTSTGTGNNNTSLIVAATGSGTYAAKYAYDLSLNGYSDWYLPSKNELGLIYTNLHSSGKHTYPTDIWYWSSSEVTVSAYLQDFSDGTQYASSKCCGVSVRVIAVRTWILGADQTVPTGANGDILYSNAGSWTALPIGTTGQVLKVTSGFPAWGAVTGTGTVTSVGLTAPTGLTVSGSPVTSSGTLGLSLTSGYSIPTTANQTNWTAGYNDKIASVAVTGTTTKTVTLTQQDGGTVSTTFTDQTGTAGGGVSVSEYDGDPSLGDITNIQFSGASVASNGSNTALVTVPSLWTSGTSGIYNLGNVHIGSTNYANTKLSIMQTTNGEDGVHIYSTTGDGLSVLSDYYAIKAVSNNGHAIYANSDSNTSIYSYSKSSTAVLGNSDLGIGVYGASSTNYGGKFSGLGINLEYGGLSLGNSQYFIINQDGTISPKSLADGPSIANNTIYYSSTQGKLVYKDSGGTVHALY